MLFLSLLLPTVFPIVAAQTKSYVCVAGQCLQGVAGTNSLSPHPCRSIHVLTCLYSRCHPQHTIKPSCFTSPGRIHFINPASAIIYRAILPARITVFSIRFLIIFILSICHHISAIECILTTRCPIISSTLITHSVATSRKSSGELRLGDRISLCRLLYSASGNQSATHNCNYEAMLKASSLRSWNSSCYTTHKHLRRFFSC